MKMQVNPASVHMPNNRIELILGHADETLTWQVTHFNKKVFTEDLDITEHINSFWSTLPMSRQQKIFEIYQQIHQVFSEVWESIPLISALRPLVAQLYAEHDLGRIGDWIAFHATNIHIPLKFKDIYEHSDEKAGNREKTYTKPDYIQLIGLVLALRPMVPIWGEFIAHTYRETGTAFKEYYAYQLLAQTKLGESEAMTKLQIYIRSNIKIDEKNPINPNNIVDGLGTEDYAPWLLGALLVNRICVGDIRGYEDSPCLVVTSFKYITGRINGANGTSGSSMGEQIRKKDFASSNDEQEASQIEGYKIKQQLPIGAIAPFEHFLDKPYQALKRIYPEADVKLFDLLHAHAKQLASEQIWPCQIHLTAWMVARVISPEALQHIYKPHTLVTMAMAQTVLWQKGHHKLAALITCMASKNEHSQLYSGTGVMMRIPRELVDKITALYPYQRIDAKRQKTTPPNTAIATIDKMAEAFNTRDWILTLPDELAVQLIGQSNNRRYPCPHDIKVCLAKLVAEIGERV